MASDREIERALETRLSAKGYDVRTTLEGTNKPSKYVLVTVTGGTEEVDRRGIYNWELSIHAIGPGSDGRQETVDQHEAFRERLLMDIDQIFGDNDMLDDKWIMRKPEHLARTPQKVNGIDDFIVSGWKMILQGG